MSKTRTMRHLVRNKNFYFIFCTDLVLVAAAFYLSYVIRFDFEIPESNWKPMIGILPLILCVKMSTFFLFQMYRGMWRYTSLFDLLNVMKAVSMSTLLIITTLLFVHRFQGYPRSVFLIDAALTLLFVGGIRAGIRLHFTRNTGMGILPGFLRGASEGKRLLIIGAGDAGEKVVREILDHPALQLIPVGFLDHDLGKQGKTIHGVKVLGDIEDIAAFTHQFDEILIAISSAPAEQMRRIVAACEKTGKRFRTIPSLGELIDGKVSMKTIRDVTLQDLLGREEIRLNQEKISHYLDGKRVLITGAGGSIGSELVRQVSRFRPGALGLVEMSELNLFQIEMECRQRFQESNPTGFLTDIRDLAAIRRVFATFHPQVVFHAAAYKHVPLQELHPWETVHNNILGTRNLVSLARDYTVERFVLVSTDKAVRPTSVMGATKRVAEKLVVSSNGHRDSRFIAVRFGNVVGSSGSVIPIFQEQIAQGGPVTVTHPDVTRYFMSIPEAVQLILEAGAMGNGGEIFILDMGNPVRIAELAQDLIRLHGYEPDKDIPITYIGLRPGEKLYEELITEGEGIVETGHEKILVLQGNGCKMNGLQHQVDELLAINRSFDIINIKRKLQEIVPEYTPEL